MARADSMAAIDAALQSTPLQPARTGTETTQNVMSPHAAPGVNAPTPITGNEKGASTEKPKKEKSEEDILAEQEAAAQKELAEQQRQQDLFKKSADATVDAAGRIVKNTSVTLERIPTPGSIVFPLIVLGVFFFLLLPVNGHTRFVWLWLVLTGNAEISNGASGDFGDQNSTHFKDTADTTKSSSAIPSSIPLPNFTLPMMMTGAEDV